MKKSKKQSQFTENDALLEGGEEAEAEAPAEDKKEEEKKSEKKEEEKKEEVDDDDDPYAAPILEPCCCCTCVCSNEFTKDDSCCACFPIKCGAVTIGIFTLLVTVILFVWYFFLFLNEYIHWWYVLVVLILLCPALVAANFVVTWFTGDTKTTRALLMTSQILMIVSVVLVCIWNLCYFIWLYKKDAFYAGMGDIPTNTYTKQSKKTFLFTMLAETVILIVFHAYFLCVTSAYMVAMHGPEDGEAPPPMEEEKSEKKESEKKPSEKAE